jgi:fatty acid/phospholipid biosynthesis enzyme
VQFRKNEFNRTGHALMTVSSIFSQMLQLIPRPAFARMWPTAKTNGTHGLHLLGQTVAMLFCHLGQAKSLSSPEIHS